MTRRTLPVALACAALSLGCNAPLFAFYFPVRGVVAEAPSDETDAQADAESGAGTGAGTPSPDPTTGAATHSAGPSPSMGPCCPATAPPPAHQPALEGELEVKGSPLPVPELPLGQEVAQ